jgi:hypothetical protein
MRGKKLVKALLSLTAVLAAAVGTAVPAQAATNRAAAVWDCNGTQNLCLSWGTFSQGSHVSFAPGVNDPNLADNVFTASGTGQGQSVANNTLSASNYNLSHIVVLCTGVNYSGVCRILAAPGYWDFDPSFARNVESFYWGR